MKEKKNRRPWWQWLLAAVGVAYLLGAAGWRLYVLVVAESRFRGPSEIAVHPEKAREMMARDRADQLRTRLGLTEEQTEQLTRILQAGAEGPPGPETYRQVLDRVRGILTPAQRQLLGDGPDALGPPPGMPGPPGGGRRGGAGRRMDPDRLEALKEHVPPEMLERFEQRVQEIKERQARWRDRGRPGPGFPMESPPVPPPGGIGPLPPDFPPPGPLPGMPLLPPDGPVPDSSPEIQKK